MKKTALTFAALLIGIFSFGQDYGEIHGRLQDYITGEYLPFATVSTSYGGNLKGAVTDEDGRFKLKPLPPGKYDLVFQTMGYDTKTVQGIEVTPGKIYMLGTIQLSTNNELPGYELIEHVLIDFDQPNTMVMKAADIRHNAMMKSPALMIGTITPELKTDANGEFIVRSSRPGTSLTMIDGVKITGPMGSIPGAAIKTITVHTGGIPAQYGDLTGGIVVIETKSFFDYFYSSNASF